MTAASDLAAGHSPSLRYPTQRGMFAPHMACMPCTARRAWVQPRKLSEICRKCCREIQLRHSQSHRSVTLPGLVEVTAARSPAGTSFASPGFASRLDLIGPKIPCFG
jgi:hypothetical protein